MHRNGLSPRPKGKPSTPHAPGESLLVPAQQRHRFSLFKTAFGPASAATPPKIPARRARTCSLITAPCVRFCNHARTVCGLRHPPLPPRGAGPLAPARTDPGKPPLDHHRRTRTQRCLSWSRAHDAAPPRGVLVDVGRRRREARRARASRHPKSRRGSHATPLAVRRRAAAAAAGILRRGRRRRGRRRASRRAVLLSGSQCEE